MNKTFPTIKKITLHPEKVIRVVCPQCGELQIKVYPWSQIIIQPGMPIPLCKKCTNKAPSQ